MNEQAKLTQRTAAPFPDSGISHLMQGWTMAYTIVLPKGWTPDWRNLSFDMTAEQAGLHVAVVAGQSVGDVAAIERMARAKILAGAVQSRVTDSSPVQINGRTWREFGAQMSFASNSPGIDYQYYMYSGDEGLFQVIGWREGIFQDGDVASIGRIATSFRFPPVAPLTTQTPQTAQGASRKYRLTIPAGWTVSHNVRDFEITAYHPPISLGVIVAPSQMGTKEEVLLYSRMNLRAYAANLQFSEVSTVKIDDRDWLRFTARGEEKEIAFLEECCVYVGPEGAFRLIGRVHGTWQQADENTMREVMMSFRFTPAP